jgi:hypothetical protein
MGLSPIAGFEFVEVTEDFGVHEKLYLTLFVTAAVLANVVEVTEKTEPIAVAQTRLERMT